MGSCMSKNEEKKSKKNKKANGENKKEKKQKKAKKGGANVSASSTSSSSDAEIEERHVIVKEGDLSANSRHQLQSDIKNSLSIDDVTTSTSIENSAGPYTPADDLHDGRVIREERREQIYKIVGRGNEPVPGVDPTDASLIGTISRCIREREHAPNVTMLVENMVVREKSPIPQLVKEVSLPHTTVHTWHETDIRPETVTHTEEDEHGNIIKRTLIKTEQVRHTVQTQSYQTCAVDESIGDGLKEEPTRESTSDAAVYGNATTSPPKELETHTRMLAYENGGAANGVDSANAGNLGGVEESVPGELISAKTVTTGNRTVETLTYKKETDGVAETHVEHRITIHGGEEIDHDAELSRAILEATNMNPEMTVEKVIQS